MQLLLKNKLIILLVIILSAILFTKPPEPISNPKKLADNNKDFFLKHQQKSLTDPQSEWVIVNKILPLNPIDYAPNNLTVPNVALRFSEKSSEMQLQMPASRALEKLFEAANKDDVQLLLASGYRPYGIQKIIYDDFQKSLGQKEADTQSAKPGFSEHQTGLAVDISSKSRECEIKECFAETKAGKWLKKNAYKYGFIIRYNKNQEKTVGYIYEPWHFRYVGIDLSTQLHKQNYPPLESFFNLPPAPDYK